MRAGIVVVVLSVVLSSNALADDGGGSATLHVVKDAAANRLWVLREDALYLYELGNRAPARRFELPGWIHVGPRYACAPALALDAGGAAIVTSNVVPVLWRIEPAASTVRRHELELDADQDKDVGFTGLAYAPGQGVFFAVSATHGSLWRIERSLSRAHKLPLSGAMDGACGMAIEPRTGRRPPVLALCPGRTPVRGWTAQLSFDQGFAYVFPRYCLPDTMPR